MDKVFFTWLTNHSCNYRCPYCFSCGNWEEIAKNDRYFSRETILSARNRIKNKYGECHIAISGGESTLYPEFISLIREISLMMTSAYQISLPHVLLTFVGALSELLVKPLSLSRFSPCHNLIQVV